MIKIIVFGDSYVTVDNFKEAMKPLFNKPNVKIRIVDIIDSKGFTPRTPSERSIKEYRGDPQQLIDEIEDEEILIVHAAPVTDKVMDASENLELIGAPRGGPVNVDVKSATERGIPVINAPGRNAVSVAEFTVGLVIAEVRSIARAYCKLKRDGVWREGDFYRGPELEGKTFGMVGFGIVGREVAKRLRGFGVEITVFDPYVTEREVKSFGAKKVDLETIMKESDFVSIHARLTPETEGLVGRREISLMKESAYLINTSRGPIVDKKALTEALENNRIAGAALDVYVEEPLPPESPLYGLNNATITPHIAGASLSVPLRCARMITKSIERYIFEKKLEHVLNPEVLRES